VKPSCCLLMADFICARGALLKLLRLASLVRLQQRNQTWAEGNLFAVVRVNMIAMTDCILFGRTLGNVCPHELAEFKQAVLHPVPRRSGACPAW